MTLWKTPVDRGNTLVNPHPVPELDSVGDQRSDPRGVVITGFTTDRQDTTPQRQWRPPGPNTESKNTEVGTWKGAESKDTPLPLTVSTDQVPRRSESTGGTTFRLRFESVPRRGHRLSITPRRVRSLGETGRWGRRHGE